MDANKDLPKELAYDLRQVYARLVGEHLIDVADARKSKNFYEWFKALEDIKTITKHKFRKKKEVMEEYDRKVKEVTELANKYPSTWGGETTNPVEFSLIENALRKLEEFLYDKMEEGKVFGELYKTSGL